MLVFRDNLSSTPSENVRQSSEVVVRWFIPQAQARVKESVCSVVCLVPGSNCSSRFLLPCWARPANGSATRGGTARRPGPTQQKVAGVNYGNAWPLMRAAPGTALKLGLQRGATVTVVLAPPS